MSVGQKLAMLKIRSTSVRFLSFHDLEAAPEEAMQLRRLIKSSKKNLGPYLFGKFEFGILSAPKQRYQGLQYLEKTRSNRVKKESKK